MFSHIFQNPMKHRRSESPRFTRLPAALLLLVALMGMPAGLFAQPDTASSGVQSYSIVPGSLGQALEQFSRISGVRLSYDTALADGVETSGLSGTFTVEEGLSTLLTGTGLAAVKQSDGGWMLHQLRGEGDTVELPTYRVYDSAGLGTTELSMDQIHRTGANELADIFSDEPSVVVGGGTRAAQRIYVRGVEATNLNVSVDGAVQGMNLFQHRGNIGGLNPDLLKSVEVQTGPGADQGSGALAGSIRFETMDAQDLLETGDLWGAALRTNFATVDEAFTKGASSYVQSPDGKIGLVAYGSRVDFEDYESGDGETVKGSGGEDESLFFKFSLLDLSGHSLRLSADKYNNSGLYAGDHAYSGGSRNLSYQVSERYTYTLDHRFQSEATDLINSKINLFYNESSLEFTDRDSKTTSEGGGGGLKNLAAFNLGQAKNSLTTGIDYYSQEGIQENSGVEDDTDIEVTTLGVYLQDRITYGPFLFSLGVRYDDFDTVFSSLNITGDEISPNAGVDVKIAKYWTLSAAYGEATRSTGIMPIQWLSNAESDVTLNQQEGKKSYGKPFEPEISKQYEGGLGYSRNGQFVGGDLFSAEITFFKTDIENLISQIGGMRGQAVTGFYNDDPVTSEGFEVRADWRFGNFKTSVSFTRADTTDSDGNAISMSRRKGASTGDRLVWNSFLRIMDSLNVGYTLNYTGALKEDDLDRDGYVLHNVQAQYQPGFLSGLDITLSVQNLFDHAYSEQTSSGDDDSAAPEPGRDIRIGMTYRF